MVYLFLLLINFSFGLYFFLPSLIPDCYRSITMLVLKRNSALSRLKAAKVNSLDEEVISNFLVSLLGNGSDLHVVR